MDNLIQQAIAKVHNTARQILDRTTIDESIGGAVNSASNFLQNTSRQVLDNQGWYRQGSFAPLQQISEFRIGNNPSVGEAFKMLPQQAAQDWGNAGLVNNTILPQPIKSVLAPAVQLGPASYMNAMAKGITTFARPTSTFDKIGDVAGMIGANMPSQAGQIVTNGLMGAGFNAINNLSQGKPIMDNFIPSYQQGVDFGYKLGPLSKAAHTVLNPALTKVLGSTETPISKYIELANKAATPEQKSQILKVAVQRFGAGVVKEAVISSAGMGAYGATEPAQNNQDRLNNVFNQAGQGFVFGAGSKIFGAGADVGFNNVIKPIIQGIKNPSDGALKQMSGKVGLGTKNYHPDDLMEMKEFTDYAQNKWQPKDKYSYEASMRDMAGKYGINPNQPNGRLAAKFAKILDQNWDVKNNEPLGFTQVMKRMMNQEGGVALPEGMPEPTKVKGKVAPAGAGGEVKYGGEVNSPLKDALEVYRKTGDREAAKANYFSYLESEGIYYANRARQINNKIDAAIAKYFSSKAPPTADLPAQSLEAPAISTEAKMVSKAVPELPQPKAPELLPWELPQDVSATALPKKITPAQLGTDKIKTELNQPESVQVQPQKIISPALEKDIKNTEKLVPGKVNLLDWLRTPDRVLTKLGLGKEAQAIRSSYNNYLDQLPLELNKINKWYEQVKQDPTASQRIFKYLDGQEGVTLNSVEKKVAGEMQTYLKEWADKLDLPYDNRIASYITHIFEPDFIKKDFDEDIAKIIADKIPGSVYDPFLQQRLGAKGYVEDAFRALDAYVKRATRKVNMDPALEALQKGGERLPLESMKYVKSYADRINMRPTMVDSLLDNLVKDSPIGYKLGQRPVTSVSKKIRQAVYRGTLGLNFGSALRNLTQGVNTYAKLGERYTAEGYIKVIPEILSGSNELKASGVLRDNIIQDRQISAFKGVMEKLDSGLFAFFNLAEKINRGSAYFGAKAKYLNEGLTEAQAIKRAVDLVRQTQFTFGSVDTPVALQSDLVKTFTQFQSFNIKQTEFLTEMIKNKELAGGIRWAGANLLLIASVGKLIGLSPKDMIPFGSILSGDSKLGETPPIKLATDVYKAAINAPDKYGNTSDDPALYRIGNALGTNAPAFIPGGVQIKKTIQGVQGVQEHGSYNKSGNLQYPIDETTGNYVRAGLFGKNNLSEAQSYFEADPNPLSEKQTERYKSLTGQAQKDFYTQTLAQRAQDNVLKAQKEAFKKGTTVPAPAPANENILQEISNVINPKPATPTTTPSEDTRFMYQGVDGSIRTIDTAKINAMPSTSNVEALIKRKEAYKLVDDVYKLPQEQQAKALSQLGISQADASYYRIANNDSDVKDAFVRERLTELAQKGGTHNDMLKTLIGLRYQLNGKMIATDTVIKNLYNDGLLTSQEYTELKNLKVSNGGIRTKRLKAKKGRKPAFTKVKMGRLKRIKVPKLKSIKLKAIKLNLPQFKTKAKLANQKPR